uniref:Uncharacterized protein n=1 Tax=Anguilla anguilla TaxID=7936 RepID=A0A0E9UJI8_ANGAN
MGNSNGKNGRRTGMEGSLTEIQTLEGGRACCYYFASG